MTILILCSFGESQTTKTEPTPKNPVTSDGTVSSSVTPDNPSKTVTSDGNHRQIPPTDGMDQPDVPPETSPSTVTLPDPLKKESTVNSPSEPSLEEEKFIEKLWNKELGHCFMTEELASEFDRKWLRYRILTRARYNILAKSYFGEKLPKLSPIEIDKAFQYQALEPMTCPGLSDEERLSAVMNALDSSIKIENSKAQRLNDSLKTLFDLDEEPKRLEDYLDLFNDPAFIAVPYGLQDGYDLLFLKPYGILVSKSQATYSYISEDGNKITRIWTPEDLRAIDAIARTLWTLLGPCSSIEGHYQLLMKIISEITSYCEQDSMVNQRYCRSDPIGVKLKSFEQVISNPSHIATWIPSSIDYLEVTNKVDQRIAARGFRKPIRANAQLKKALCPWNQEFKSAPKDLKSAYLAAIEFYRDPLKFAKRWTWPNSFKGRVLHFSYGVPLDKASPKNLHILLDRGVNLANSSPNEVREFDFKKLSNPQCPTPYLYEKR